jgi:uncharacterized membrane protein
MFSFGKKHLILINSLQLTIHYSIDFLAVIIIISTLMLSNANEYITIIINIIITDNNYAAKIVDATVVSVRHHYSTLFAHPSLRQLQNISVKFSAARPTLIGIGALLTFLISGSPNNSKHHPVC